MAYGITETKYKDCIIKTMESDGRWEWKIDTSTGLSILWDTGTSYSEDAAIRDAKRRIDEAIRQQEW